MSNDTLVIALNDAKLEATSRNVPTLARDLSLRLIDAGKDQHATNLFTLAAAGHPVTVDQFRTECARIASALFAEDNPQERLPENETPDLPAALHAALDALMSAAPDNAASFGCGETDRIVTLFRAADRHADAAGFLAFHAEDDDEGDAHYREPEWSPGCRLIFPDTTYQCGADTAPGIVYCTTHAHHAGE